MALLDLNQASQFQEAPLRAAVFYFSAVCGAITMSSRWAHDGRSHMSKATTMPGTPNQELLQRRAIVRNVSRTILRISGLIHDGYHVGTKSPLGMAAVYLVAFCIAALEGAHGVNVSEIARETRLDRSTVRNALEQLISDKIVMKIDDGHKDPSYCLYFDVIGSLPPGQNDWRVDWNAVALAILECARQLKALLSI